MLWAYLIVAGLGLASIPAANAYCWTAHGKNMIDYSTDGGVWSPIFFPLFYVMLCLGWPLALATCLVVAGFWYPSKLLAYPGKWIGLAAKQRGEIRQIRDRFASEAEIEVERLLASSK